MKQYIVKYRLEGEVELEIDSVVEDIEAEAQKQIEDGEMGDILGVEIQTITDVESDIEDV